MSGSRLSVAQFVHCLDPGETERLVVDLASRLTGEIDVRVCCLDRAGDWANDVRRLGIPVHVLARRSECDLRAVERLAQLSRAHHVEVLHCHQYTPFLYGQLASAFTRTALVYTEHGSLADAPPSPQRRRANEMLGRLPCEMFAVSHELRRFMSRAGLSPHRIRVVHDGIEPGPAPGPEARGRARAVLNLPDSSFVVGTAARLDAAKNLGVALRAFAAAATLTSADARFVVIGDGPERRRLQRTADALGIARRTHFLGHRNDVRGILPAFDVYVNSSITEGISLSILEAMAAGVAVVATAVGGTPEIIARGVDGILVPENDPAALASQLQRLAADPEERQRLARAGRDRVSCEFTAERLVEEYRDVYRAVVNRVHPMPAVTMHPHPAPARAAAAGADRDGHAMSAGKRRR